MIRQTHVDERNWFAGEESEMNLRTWWLEKMGRQSRVIFSFCQYIFFCCVTKQFTMNYSLSCNGLKAKTFRFEFNFFFYEFLTNFVEQTVCWTWLFFGFKLNKIYFYNVFVVDLSSDLSKLTTVIHLIQLGFLFVC